MSQQGDWGLGEVKERLYDCIAGKWDSEMGLCHLAVPKLLAQSLGKSALGKRNIV